MTGRAQATVSCYYTSDGMKSKTYDIKTFHRCYIRTESVNEMDLTAAISAKQGRTSGNLSTAYSEVKREENETETETRKELKQDVEYNDNLWQVFRTVTTTFSSLPSLDRRQNGSVTSTVHIRTQSQEPTKESLHQEACDYMQAEYECNGQDTRIQIDLEKPFATWMSISRGDLMPSADFGVYAGTTGSDGDVWVGRFDGVPGKINTTKDSEGKVKMWNCWVHSQGSSRYGEILVTNMEQKWEHFEKHQDKHEGLVGDKLGGPMRSESDGGLVVVAKTYETEPGKLNFFDGKTYCHLWAHESGKSTRGLVLILK